MSASDALHPDQFRMQTNIKAASGSQGTLFQGGYPTRYPRGYTPERQRALTEAANWLDPQNIYKPHAPATAAMRDTLARSTVPVEHVQGLHFTATPHAENELESIDARGVYKRPGSTALAGGLVKVHPDAVRGMTVIHEVGHHASYTSQTEHSAYDTPERRGTEEGYAENYSETHFRDRRGKQQRSTTPSGAWAGREETMAASADVRNAFDKKRKESPLAQGPISQAETNAMSPRQRGLPPQHVEGQIPLLDKVGSSGGGYVERYEGGVRNKPGEPRHWDYTFEDRDRGLKRERD